jgi:hypothetical protein
MNDEQYSTTEYIETTAGEKVEQFERMAPRKIEENRSEPWLADAEIDELQSRWNSVQIEFIDEPRASVEQAEALVAETTEKIVRMLSERKASVDQDWRSNNDITTEDLRMALQRYRTFFNRLITM